MQTLFINLMLLCPLLAIIFNRVLVSIPMVAARLSGYLIGIAFLIGAELLALSNVNQLSLLLCCLVLMVSFIVHRFSLRYMHGDRLYRRFFLLLPLLTLTAMLMVIANNLFIFWGAWTLSNVSLVLLMVHKKEWVASKNSGILALQSLILGSVCILIAFILLSVGYSTSSIDVLNQIAPIHDTPLLSVAMTFIVAGALIQSGLFPFHRWLISSLNSPTPVSALMHAGLVNGGGILVVKFSPILIGCHALLSALFIVGSLSALLGTTWKLMQHDIKKMQACSTMAQMGFMMMQCGVGLFAAAIAHLCWHGLFKAYLFLSSGSALEQQKIENHGSKVTLPMVITALAGGVVAMMCFALVTHKSISLHEANAFVLFFAFVAGSQLFLTWIRSHQTWSGLFSGLLFASFSGFMYGGSIQFVQWLIPSIAAINAPQLSFIHWLVMILFGVFWGGFSFGVEKKWSHSKLGCRLYMALFNASQPSAKTMTALRNEYNY